MSRVAGAIQAVHDAIGVVIDEPAWSCSDDDDLVDDVGLDEIKLESLGLILEEIFAIVIPHELWRSPLWRTPASLADWCIRKSEEAAWAETQRQRRRA